jgi:hypothetical protein
VATDADLMRALTQALHDSLMVIAPPGWTQVELEVAASAQGLRLHALSARGDGAKEPPTRAPLNIDPKEEASRLGEGLTELSGLLAANGKRWHGGKVQITRGEGFVDWKLLQPDGSALWFTRLLREQLDALLFTDALFDLLRGTERAFSSLQHSFGQKVGKTTSHRYSEDDRILSLDKSDGTTARASAQLVGSYSRENFLWVWGWAVAEVSPECSERVKRICAPDAAQAGLSALWRDHFHCDEGFAWALSSHIAVSIGARGLVRAEDVSLPVIAIYAVLEDPA